MTILGRKILPECRILYILVVFDEYFLNYRYKIQRDDKHKNSNFSLSRT